MAIGKVKRARNGPLAEDTQKIAWSGRGSRRGRLSKLMLVVDVTVKCGSEQLNERPFGAGEECAPPVEV